MVTASFLVLSLGLVCASVSSAPTRSPLHVDKRVQERILFGNQQNDPRVMKKRSDSAGESLDNSNDPNADKQGFIKAMPAKEEADSPVNSGDSEPPKDVSVSQGTDVQDQAIETADASDQNAAADETPSNTDVAEAETEDASTEAANQESDLVEEELADIMTASQAEAENPADNSEATEPQETEETEETEAVEEPVKEQVMPEEEQNTDENAALMQTDNMENNPLMDLYYYMLENEKARESYYPYPENYYPYRRRRSSSRPVRAVTEGDMARNVVKRSKRIKRDLLDDVESYYYPYGYGNEYTPELSEEGLYELYRPEPRYEDEVAELLDMYEQAQEEPTYEPYVSEEVYPELFPEEELEEEEEEEEFPQYVPSKRQMMSSLPGIKKRYFYPFNREPDTHWGAFVPQKRSDYEETYKRLLTLASALSEDSPYYQLYKKK